MAAGGVGVDHKSLSGEAAVAALVEARVQKEMASAIWSMAHSNTENEIAIAKAGGIPPLIALLEPEQLHGGMTYTTLTEQLSEAMRNLEHWGLADEIQQREDDEGLGPRPDAGEVLAALFAREVLEWNRVAVRNARPQRTRHACRSAHADRLEPWHRPTY